MTCFQQRTSSASSTCWMVAVGQYTLAAANSFGMTLAYKTIRAVSGARRWGFICTHISTLMAEMLRGAVDFPCRKIGNHVPKDRGGLELRGVW